MPDIQCPICNHRFKIRIATHLEKAHGIGKYDAMLLKNRLAHITYFPNATTERDEILQILKTNHFYIEKLRM
jgi:hypothetical protein